MIDVTTKVDSFDQRLIRAKQELESMKSQRLREQSEAHSKINELRDGLNHVTNMLNLKTSEFRQLQKEFKDL